MSYLLDTHILLWSLREPDRLGEQVKSLEHQDPADRFLAATASVYELILITADARLLGGRGFKTLSV
jgi:PIN domain nuclease of toxin-antitoxin system